MSIDPFSKDLLKQIKRARRISFFILLWEELSLRLWRMVSWAAGFLTLSLLNIPTYFGAIAPTYVFWIFVIGLAYWFYADLLHFRWPSRTRIDRRIEKTNALPHRPLNVLDDILANPEQHITQKLWKHNQEHALQTLESLIPTQRINTVAGKDPYAIRLFTLLFFGLSLLIAGQDIPARLSTALSPQSLITLPERTAKIQLRIIPPSYTGYAQMIVTEQDKAVKIPQGSTIKAVVRKGFGTPTLELGGQTLAFEASEDKQYTLETAQTNTQFDALKIKQALSTRAKWQVEYIADHPPTITSNGDVEMNPKGVMSFPLTVYDDYGVQDLALHIELRDYSQASFATDPITMTRNVSSPAQTDFNFMPSFDITRHIWAGHEAILTLSAHDALGQKVSLAPITMILPERPFKHAVARKIIDIRKEIIADPLAPPVPLVRKIEEILLSPGLYHDDLTVFLALKSAAGRLFWAAPPSFENSRSVVDLLWDTALRVEDGGLSLAAQALKDIQRKLQEALQNGENADDISALMEEMRRAMRDYLQALSAQTPMQDIPQVVPENIIGADDLARLLEKMEQQLLAGDAQGAQETLAQIERLMEMMDPSMQAPMPADMQAMAKMLGDLRPLIDDQKALMEQTQAKAKPANELQSAQDALRQRLEEMITQAAGALPQLPPPLNDALKAMKQAAQELSGGNMDEAATQQQAAIEALQNTEGQMSEQLAQRMSQMIGINPSGRGTSMMHDPLGRPYNPDDNGRNIGDNNITIPNGDQRAQARALLDELRRRSGEYHRPAYEREYYRRLLKQF